MKKLRKYTVHDMFRILIYSKLNENLNKTSFEIVNDYNKEFPETEPTEMVRSLTVLLNQIEEKRNLRELKKVKFPSIPRQIWTLVTYVFNRKR